MKWIYLLGDGNFLDDLNGRSALHYAVLGRYVECVELLLDAGARYNVCNAGGYDALELATHLDDEKCIALLTKQSILIYRIVVYYMHECDILMFIDI